MTILIPNQILVTRANPQGEQLCQFLNEYGYQTIHFPTLAYAKPKDMDAFHQAILRLNEQDWLIFVSPYAVSASIDAIAKAWPRLPSSVKWAAIGFGSAQALKALGYQQIVYPETEWNSEGLLALPQFQTLAGKKIAIIRGEGGREQLEKICLERGAKLLSLIAYQRVLPAIETKDIPRLDASGAFVCTSFQAVSNLKTLYDRIHFTITHIPLLVVSERIKTLARDLGFQTIWVAKNASHQAILEALLEKRK